MMATAKNVAATQHKHLIWSAAGLVGATGAIAAYTYIGPAPIGTAVQDAASHAAQASTVLSAVTRATLQEAANAARVLQWEPRNWSQSLAAALRDIAADPSSRQSLVTVANGQLLDWLLETACSQHQQVQSEREPQQQRASTDTALGAIHHLLKDDASCSALLARPHAAPQLLALAAQPQGQALQLAATLHSQAARTLAANRDDRQALMADLSAAVNTVQDSDLGWDVRLAALSFLRGWLCSPAAPANHARLTGLRLHEAVAHVTAAASSAEDGPNMHVHTELLWLMRLLASGGQPGHRSTTLPPGQRPQPQDSHGSSSSAPERMLHSRHAADGAATLHLACCIQPVLYIAADAVAARDPSVTADALDTLSVLLQAGGSGAVAQAVQGAAPHLLWGIAKWASPLPEEVQKEAAARAKLSKTLITTVGVSGSAPTGSQQGASPSNANGSDEPLAARVSLSSKTGMGSLRALWGGGSNGSGQGAAGGAAPLTQGTMVPDATQPTSHLALFPEAPEVARAVAGCLATLCHANALPEKAIPRWRDWLLRCLLSQEEADSTGSLEGAAFARGRVPVALHVWKEDLQRGSVRNATHETLLSAAPVEWEGMRASVVDALTALSHAGGAHGLRAAHYWLSRLLCSLAARTLPYTSLVYVEGRVPQAPASMAHVVPILPSYVKNVCNALEHAADVAAGDVPEVPFEFGLAGVTPLQRPALVVAHQPVPHNQEVDLAGAEKCAADALEALCAVVAPDAAKQAWLLARGILPLMARLTASTDTHDADTSTSTASSAASCTAAQQDTQARHAYAAGKLDQHLAVAAGQGPATAADSEQQGDACSTILMASAVQGPGASALGAAQQAGPQPSLKAPMLTSADASESSMAMSEAAGASGASSVSSSAASGIATTTTTTAAVDMIRIELGRDGSMEAAGEATAVADFETGEAAELYTDHAGAPRLCLYRQIARMAALLALQPHAHAALLAPVTVSGTHSTSDTHHTGEPNGSKLIGRSISSRRHALHPLPPKSHSLRWGGRGHGVDTKPGLGPATAAHAGPYHPDCILANYQRTLLGEAVGIAGKQGASSGSTSSNSRTSKGQTASMRQSLWTLPFLGSSSSAGTGSSNSETLVDSRGTCVEDGKSQSFLGWRWSWPTAGGLSSSSSSQQSNAPPPPPHAGQQGSVRREPGRDGQPMHTTHSGDAQDALAYPPPPPSDSAWLVWLAQAANSPDCRLSSHAARALLNLQAALAYEHLHLRQVQHREQGQDNVRERQQPASLPGAPIMLPDGLHLLNPLAAHHWHLAAAVQPVGPAAPVSSSANAQPALQTGISFGHGDASGAVHAASAAGSSYSLEQQQGASRAAMGSSFASSSSSSLSLSNAWNRVVSGSKYACNFLPTMLPSLPLIPMSLTDGSVLGDDPHLRSPRTGHEGKQGWNPPLQMPLEVVSKFEGQAAESMGSLSNAGQPDGSMLSSPAVQEDAAAAVEIDYREYEGPALTPDIVAAVAAAAGMPSGNSIWRDAIPYPPPMLQDAGKTAADSTVSGSYSGSWGQLMGGADGALPGIGMHADGMGEGCSTGAELESDASMRHGLQMDMAHGMMSYSPPSLLQRTPVLLQPEADGSTTSSLSLASPILQQLPASSKDIQYAGQAGGAAVASALAVGPQPPQQQQPTTAGVMNQSDHSDSFADGLAHGSLHGSVHAPLQASKTQHPHVTSMQDICSHASQLIQRPHAESMQPDLDIVFVHGMRGGPFITWRRPDVAMRGPAQHLFMDRSSCWPGVWLAEDFPNARLLTVEHLAPVAKFEGESLPLEDTVLQVMEKLAAAGVGQRPVVFVCHSMGGLVVKEMLAQAAAEGPSGKHAALLKATRGVAFYGTPHFGSTLAAMGWKLRHVPGANPAPYLARLTPGPHLIALNEAIKVLHDQSHIRTVCFIEGQPTQLAGVFPKLLIVPPESGYCGFGAGFLLPADDHITVCKPQSKEAAAYAMLHQLLRDVLQ